MNEDILYQHGIKGQKWGVIRTPQQLGHYLSKRVSSITEKKSSTIKIRKSKEPTARNVKSISDEELQKKINRLNMEERYIDLIARQDARTKSGFKSTVKKLLGGATEDLGKQLLSKAVSKLVDRIGKDKGFDINKYKNMNVNDMTVDDIAKVATWYENAAKIEKGRKNVPPRWTVK